MKEKIAREEAEKYLKFKLGDRKGCDILAGLDKELQEEIIAECAKAMLKTYTRIIEEL